ncbi:MAG: tetratricopeptide repeat protein [Cyanobacteria bacterium P01_F01_bin.42]
MRFLRRLSQALPLRSLTRPLVGIACLAVAVLLLPHPSYAQRLDPVVRDGFLNDPLSDSPRDPLLPEPVVERELSPLERYELEQGMLRLDQEAQAALLAGDAETAFMNWMRLVRLRRLFGPAAELDAIAYVSQLAWDNQRSIEIQLLTLRLREIWALAQPLAEKADGDSEESGERIQLDETQLIQVASSFQTLRDRDFAIALQQHLVDLAAAQGDEDTRHQRLNDLGAMQLQWFYYAEATELYAQLAANAKADDDPEQQIFFLTQQAYSAQQAEDYASAIPPQLELLALYRELGQSDREPALEIEIARNYRRLNQFEAALTYYRIAYATAQQLEQYGHSGNVLRDLGELYQSLDRLDDALEMYTLLVRVEEQSYNYYGMMHAYDQLGQIYRTQGNQANARQAFETGLRLAQQLDHQQDYFREQILTVQPDMT